jgi:type II secretory pathway predicted ATPase ExeA/cell division septation protein DedD
MYNKFFDFKEKPFQLDPNPEYLFLSKSHGKALTHLIFTITQSRESILVTGENGTGKTTLCKAFFGNLDEFTKAAYISNPKLDGLQLLKAINDEFWLDSTPDNTKKELIEKLNGFLIKKKAAGEKILLLIDEAQDLSHEALEQVLLLANLEDSQRKLLQIILVGQPELNDMLASSELKQLGQLITKNCQLAPLSFLETIDYIKHRISYASHKKGPSFDKASCRAIYDYSKGIPQLINIGCEMALQNAFSRNSLKITGGITREAIKKLAQDKQEEPGRKSKKVRGLAILSAVLVTMIILLLYFTKGQSPETTDADKFVSKIEVPASSEPIDSAMDKLEIPEKPLVVSQSDFDENISEDRTKVPTNATPIDSAAEKLEISEKPLASKQSEKSEKIAESSDVYAVHVGSFYTAAQANSVLNDLKSLGFPSFMYISLSKNGNTVYVVVAGKYQSYKLAKEASKNLSSKGHSNFFAKAKDSLKVT